MCDKCLAVDQHGAANIHIGYTDEHDDWYNKMMEGGIVLETPNKKQLYTQENFFKLWDQIEDKFESPGMGCAVCNRTLVTVPAIEGHCEVCGVSKHERITELSENREQVKEEMEHFEEEHGDFGPGKEARPEELALRASLHCPSGHWVCANCLQFHREDIPTQE